MKKQVIQIALSVLSIILVSELNLSAQSLPGTPVIPLTPNAAELNKYTSIPVDGMTGVPSIGFPLFEINTGKIKLPISLNYHASGIKVRQKATWVGLGWSINAGGTISRGIRGKADEHSINGWFNDPTSWGVLDELWNKSLTGTPQEQYNAYNTIANQWFVNPGHDTHPDFFSYSAGSKSGKFIFSRSKQKFVSFPYEPVKIDRDPVQNTYKITDDDGTVYYFETKETVFYTEYVDEVERVQSWYLTKIVSADGTDVIQLNYEIIAAGYNNPEITETFTHTFRVMDYETGTQPVESFDKEQSISRNSVVVLKEIIFPQGKVSFIANSKRKDYVDNALDKIEVYGKQNGVYEKVKEYSFNYDYFTRYLGQDDYDYRLRLLSFKKEDVKGGQPEIHRFEYNSVPVPPISSYSADYWGFYNGGSAGLLGTREADTNNVKAGMLEKIIYPTGGYTVFDFESNKYKSDIIRTRNWTLSWFTLYGLGNTAPANIREENFQVPQDAYNETMSYEIKFYPYVPGWDVTPQRVVLKDLTTGTDIKSWEHTGDARTLKTYSESYNFNRTHQYQFYVMVQNHPSTYIELFMTYVKLDNSKLYMPGAGVRIRRIIAYDNDGTAKSAELYKYGATEDGVGKLLISDQIFANNYFTYRFARPGGYIASGPCCSTEFGTYKVYIGNITYPSFSFMGANILYDFITKYQVGGSTVNGKTVQQYNIPDDFQLVFNPRLPGGYELLDKSLFGQQLSKEINYAWDKTNSQYRPVTEKQLKYRFYNGDAELAINLWQQVTYLMNSSCSQDKVLCFGATASRDFHPIPYNITLGCYRLDNIIEKTYDAQGNIFQTTQSYEYNNGLHLYPTALTSINSKNLMVKTTTKYPGDHTAADPNSSVLDRMVSLNILNKPFWSGDYKAGALLKYVQTTYNNQWNNNLNQILPQKQQAYINGSTLSLANYKEFKSYDVNGNPLLVTDKQGLHTGYIWDYLSSYPVAEITGSGSSIAESSFTSFEAEGSGNWNIGSNNREAGGITGNGSYQLANGGINKAGLNSGSAYVVSYWTKNGNAFSINGTQSTPVKGRTVNGWTYFEHKISGVTQVDLPQTAGLIDELRLYPADAKVTTYTYTPLVGMTSACSNNNIITYYEYDGLGRLKVIKDQDGNVVKMMEYNYVGQ